MDENEEDIPRYRSGKVVMVGRALSAAETTELRRLFDLMADTCDAASTVLGRAGRAPIGSELERLKELTERVHAMADRTKSILR